MTRLEFLLYCAILGFASGFAIGNSGQGIVDESIEKPEIGSYTFTCTTDEECAAEYEHYINIR